MSDLLSSASLLIAIVTVLYGLWLPEISKGINDLKAATVRNCNYIAEVTRIIRYRALPLAIASVGLTLVFLKDGVMIVYNSRAFNGGLLDRIMNYDAVSTAFVLVEAICLSLSVHIIWQCNRLRNNLKDLKSKPNGTGEMVCP